MGAPAKISAKISATTNVGNIGIESPVDALGHLHDLVADDMAAVNRLIVTHMQSSVPLIPQLAGYIVASGGKRLRPLLTLAAARLCGYQGDRHVALAACVEFIHTATLLHDDVVDESLERRGLASANAAFGNKASVLVGDFLFSRAFQLMVADGDLGVLKVLCDASATIAEGEVLQMMTTNDLTTDQDAYLKVIEGKTAALFAAACEVGGLVAGADAARVTALRDFGYHLGMAFQLVDDILDYSADQAKLGKTVGDDFREGKITLPVVLAYAAADNAEKTFWQRTIADHQQTPDDLAHAQALLRRHQALASAHQVARTYGNHARQALAPFTNHAMQAALLGALDFTLAREF